MQFPTIPLVLVGHCGAGGGGVFDKQGQGLTVELRKLGVFFFLRWNKLCSSTCFFWERSMNMNVKHSFQFCCFWSQCSWFRLTSGLFTV